MRSRSASDVVLTSKVSLPAPHARLVADWQRETDLRLALEPGDVEVMPLARTRARWPELRVCLQAASDWACNYGIQDALSNSEMALMACRGARYHHDSAQYGDSAFCNLFLSEDKGLDLHFPASGHRIPLQFGTVVVFDTGQPHAVIRRGSSGFLAEDYPAGRDDIQVFLTWELPVEDANVAHALRIRFDIDRSNALLINDPQVQCNGVQTVVCPASGRWLPNVT
jgi:hypothetical protein